MSPKASPAAIEIRPLNIQRLELPIIGDSPLICHAWSGKAKKQMLAKQMKKAVPKKDAKDPEQDFLESLYPIPGGYGFPSVGFKSAAVSACRTVEGITMVIARGALHVEGEMVRIEGVPVAREDMVRIGMGTADIRYRGEFTTWSAVLPVKFDADVLSAEQIVSLFDRAGFHVGVGEWRPERNGIYGRFHVDAEGRP